MKAKAKRYYIARSSIFDSRPYPLEALKRAVRRSGGKNVRSAHAHGWSNQPHVVTFGASPLALAHIKAAADEVVGSKWGVIIHEVW